MLSCHHDTAMTTTVTTMMTTTKTKAHQRSKAMTTDIEGQVDDNSPVINDRLFPIPDGDKFTFAEVGRAIDEKPNTLSARWFPRLEGWLKGRDIELRVDDSPRWKLSRTAAELLRSYKLAKQSGMDDDSFKASLEERFLLRDSDDDSVIVIRDSEIVTEPTSAIVRHHQQETQLMQDDNDSLIADIVLLAQEVKETRSAIDQSEKDRKLAAFVKEELQAKKQQLEDEELRLKARRMVEDLLAES